METRPRSHPTNLLVGRCVRAYADAPRRCASRANSASEKGFEHRDCRLGIASHASIICEGGPDVSGLCRVVDAVLTQACTCDLRHIDKIFLGLDLKRLIRCTAVIVTLYFCWSALRFELDTYHGDALPTELTGPVFTCLTCGFLPRGGSSSLGKRC